MEYTIHNKHMTVVISDAGAQLISLKKDGAEYLWEGDPLYWREHAPVLFPFAGRLTNEKYSVRGKEFSMKIHGFAKHMTFAVVEQTEDSVTLGISDTEETYAQYPFHFDFQVSYTLYGCSLDISFEVENHSEELMYFGLGGHPGFKVPLDEGLSFEDYYLEFGDKCLPDKIEMDDKVFVTGRREPYPLEDSRKIRLHHDLFDHDAIVLTNMADMVTLRSEKGERCVTVCYPDFRYLGLWHAVKKDAPYVAIEPWVNLPARSGVIEDFANVSDLIRLEPEDYYSNVWTIALR